MSTGHRRSGLRGLDTNVRPHEAPMLSAAPRLTIVPLLAAAALAVAVAVAGCGSDSGGGSSTSAAKTPAATAASTPEDSAAGGQTIENGADASGKLAFDKSDLTAKAGKVTLKMANPSGLPHGIAVEGNG